MRSAGSTRAAGGVSVILFDNDGVLVDTEHLYMAASRSVLQEIGLDLSESDYVELFMRQNRGLLHYGEVHGWSADQLRTLRERRNARYEQLLATEPLFIDGVQEVLDQLARRLRLAVVTSTPREHFAIIHARTGLLPHFEFVLAAGDYPESKPHPSPYLTAVARAGVDPSACLVVEDSERGLNAAVAAGLRCVMIPNRLTRNSTFAGAWKIVDSVHDLPGVIDELALDGEAAG